MIRYGMKIWMEMLKIIKPSMVRYSCRFFFTMAGRKPYRMVFI